MKILALETTEKFGSAALLLDDHVAAEMLLPKDRRSSQTLHPALQTLFETANIVPTEIDLVAVVAGPGSFTGLRVGISAAKIFAYTAGAKIIALNTFQTVAAALDDRGTISVGVDAQRGDVVVAVMRNKSGHLDMVQEPMLMPIEDWWKQAEQFDDVLFAGPALERWGSKAPEYVVLAAEPFWFPQASTAGKLAVNRLAKEQFDDIWTLLPIYSRLSAAEEKRNSGIAKNAVLNS